MYPSNGLYFTTREDKSKSGVQLFFKKKHQSSFSRIRKTNNHLDVSQKVTVLLLMSTRPFAESSVKDGTEETNICRIKATRRCSPVPT